jgi:FkbM family methyltransferase
MLKVFLKHLDYVLCKNLKKTLFCYYMTKTSALDIQYRFDGRNYFVEDEFQTHFFIKERAKRYSGGLKKLGDRLAKSYGVEEILLNPHDIVVDVGANVGDFAIYLRKFKDIEYFGFEPSPQEFELLSRNLSINFKTFNKVVSDTDSQIKFYVSTANADSSIYMPEIVDEEIFLESVRLDSLFTHITLLKIDAEGAEVEVIKGAEKILEDIKFIAVDLGFEKGINHETTCPDVINYLLGNNFKILNFTPRGCFLLQNNRYIGI